MNDLNFYKGHWSAIPHALATLTSGNAFLLLFNIIRNSTKPISNESICLSKNRLAIAMGVSYHTVNNSIKELEELNILSASPSNGSTTSFKINWSEIEKIHSVSSQTTDEGWCALRKSLRQNNGFLSELSQQDIEYIKHQYKRTYVESTYAKNAEVDDEPMQKLHSLSNNTEQTYAEIAEVVDKAMKKLHSFITTYAENAEVMKILGEKAMQYGLDKLPTYAKSAELTSKSYAEIAEVVPKSYAISAYSIDIYKDKEKDHNERSSFNKGGEKELFEKDKNVLAWFNKRDDSFPVLSSMDFETIINLPEFSDSDFDKAVRQVWGYLQYNEESPEENFTPLELFRDFLYRAWNDLKESSPDFSLSEQDMKNIFAFDVVEHDGELSCCISPSKIKNITALPEPERKPRRKGMEDRLARTTFIESIQQIANKDTNLLTDAEYAIWLMMKFVKDRQDKEQPHPDEITKLVYADLLEQIAEESRIPVEELKALWKELPQKGMVKLHPQQLSVEKIIDYNTKADQASDVEELYNAKMAEQQ